VAGEGMTPSPISMPVLDGVFALVPTAWGRGRGGPRPVSALDSAGVGGGGPTPSMSFSKSSMAAAAFAAIEAMLPHIATGRAYTSRGAPLRAAVLGSPATAV